MRCLDLFSGIGGFALACRWAGIETAAFCEIDPYCQKVLAKNFPGVPIYGDIRTLTADGLVRDGITDIDLITGGFPCQDVSDVGKRKGITGERSNLYREIIRLIIEIQPPYIIMENVTALLYRGLGRVLGDLAAIGYDAEWHCFPASYIGAAHNRDRIFIVAYPTSMGLQPPILENINTQERIYQERQPINQEGLGVPARIDSISLRPIPDSTILRVADEVPDQLDRYKGLGNAVVPQQVYPILKAIAEQEAE